MSKLQVASKTARAIGSITWAVESVIRLTGKGCRKLVSRFTDEPTYDIDLLLSLIHI